MEMAYDFASGRRLESALAEAPASASDTAQDASQDHGLDALAAILSMYRIPADASRWRHELAHQRRADKASAAGDENAFRTHAIARSG